MIGAVAVIGVALTACGPGDSGAADTAGAGELHEVKVGYFPLVHTATIVQADEAGYLEEAGIDAELVQTEGGAAAIPSLVSGEVDILYSKI